MSKLFLSAVLSVMLSVSSVAWAEEETDKLETIRIDQGALRDELDSGETWGMKGRQIMLVKKNQKTIFELIEGKSTLDEIAPDDQVRVFNALENINAIMANTSRATGEKQVCWRERTSGTKIMETRCASESELKELREGARAFKDKRGICVPPGCGQ